MATNIKGFYSDLKYGYIKLFNGDFSQCYDENAINQSLFTLLNTRKGERFFNPEYGSDIYKYLYEPFDERTGNSIAEEIQFVINRYEGTRITITDINIELMENQQYNISVMYSINSTTLTGVVNLNMQKA